MANICTFEGYVKGPQADVKRFKKAMEEVYRFYKRENPQF